MHSVRSLKCRMMREWRERGTDPCLRAVSPFPTQSHGHQPSALPGPFCLHRRCYNFSTHWSAESSIWTFSFSSATPALFHLRIYELMVTERSLQGSCRLISWRRGLQHPIWLSTRSSTPPWSRSTRRTHGSELLSARFPPFLGRPSSAFSFPFSMPWSSKFFALENCPLMSASLLFSWDFVCKPSDSSNFLVVVPSNGKFQRAAAGVYIPIKSLKIGNFTQILYS